MFATTHARYWQDLTEKAAKINVKITLLSDSQIKIEHTKTKTVYISDFKDDRNIWNEIHSFLLGVEFGLSCGKPAKKTKRIPK